MSDITRLLVLLLADKLITVVMLVLMINIPILLAKLLVQHVLVVPLVFLLAVTSMLLRMVPIPNVSVLKTKVFLTISVLPATVIIRRSLKASAHAMKATLRTTPPVPAANQALAPPHSPS